MTFTNIDALVNVDVGVDVGVDLDVDAIHVATAALALAAMACPILWAAVMVTAEG